ncbi:heparinase II/III family protein [Sphingobacterium sp. SGR-19]|uniref:heparinase II/III domain-containing protein n=1 Tax=Sphingobacterium sp. SGR-19 TaxID=2710886 RepID=UPI0013EB9586|nr:heparinase II/III family protein [Sphingobacterium sp. SGR-19]NGM67218.1 hypothetical protein [Sphingobacterium sp. SGR-19]
MLYYRLSIKFGLRKGKFKIGNSVQGVFFHTSRIFESNHESQVDVASIIRRAEEIRTGLFTYYHYHQFSVGDLPDWFYDPFSEKRLSIESREKHWTDINEFDLNTGDIKNLWELSRFDWVTDLTRAYRVSGEMLYMYRLNDLLNHWSLNNPPNVGVNWLCGQETTIRLMKLFNASLVLDNVDDISLELWEFAYQHLERIAGNINYAIAQDNNHGTTEAAGLYIGALWLSRQKKPVSKKLLQQLEQYKKRGRQIFIERLKKLILPDGTFAQKSVNYHRVVMDTVSFVLYGIKRYDEPMFSSEVTHKLNKLGDWLLQMVSNDNGEVPCLGANDGAMFENLHNSDYRDYRPCIQLYFALLNGILIWEDNSVNESLFWRSIDLRTLNKQALVKHKSSIRDKEFVQLFHHDLLVRIKATQDNFRPMNDVLNLDVWYKGRNIIIDSGSFSYNAKSSGYFKSIMSHNTLQFDDQEPMPRISRFLNGAWINVKGSDQILETADQITWTGEYRDYRGNIHQRTIVINKQDMVLKLKDRFESPCRSNKKLRFNLSPGIETLIDISCKGNFDLRFTEAKGEHSFYYMNKETHKVFVYETEAERGQFETSISFRNV